MIADEKRQSTEIYTFSTSNIYIYRQIYIDIYRYIQIYRYIYIYIRGRKVNIYTTIHNLLLLCQKRLN